jgi:DNA-directed RNA polymerase subunit RPC12/RpoP
MNVTYHCPTCNHRCRETITSATSALGCPACNQQIAVPNDAIEGGRITRCLVCPSRELYARKDFPQRLGVALVVFGFVASSIAWANYQVFWTFAILFATALIDLLLYVLMGESLTCYRCSAQYRGSEEIERHGGFDLETHERHRQMVARMKSAVAVSTAEPTK